LRGIILTPLRVLLGKTSLTASEVGFLPDATGTVTIAPVHVTSSFYRRRQCALLRLLRRLCHHQKKVVCFTRSLDIIKSAGVITPSLSGVLQPCRAFAYVSAHVTSSLRRRVSARYYAFYGVFRPLLEKVVSFSRSTGSYRVCRRYYAIAIKCSKTARQSASASFV